MLGVIDAEAVGGPEDGAVVRAERRAYTMFVRTDPHTGNVFYHLYALEVHDGRFRLKYLMTDTNP